MGAVMKLDKETLAVLTGAETHGSKLKINTQLDRVLYAKVNKALVALGGKWTPSVKAHVFEGDAAERIEEACVTGTVTDLKKLYDFFETPSALAKQLVRMAELHSAELDILEPSAGRGAIAREIRAACRPARLGLVEIQEENCERLRRENEGDPCVVVKRADFLTCPLEPPHVIDRIIMNPPFSKQQDIDHVMHAWTLLRPGGILVSVMSAGVKFRSNKKTQAFRTIVHMSGGTITDLPEGSFEASGTNVNAVVVRMVKP